MDAISIDLASAPYRMFALDTDEAGRPSQEGAAELRQLISRSRLVYGQAYNAGNEARKSGVPFIGVVEYDLRTQITANTCNTDNPIRKLVRATRTVVGHFADELPGLAGAAALHCNGYPIYDAMTRRHANCLLYLDSRVRSDMVIGPEELGARLADRPRRRPKLLYSGRFARMKGACDVVATGILMLKSGLAFELHLYGQGPEKARMQAMIDEHGAGHAIQIHDALPFPQLFEISKSFDLFVCCHIQSDPSCTYLEAHGAGLAIAGYDNRMWRRLCGEARSGIISPMGDPGGLAQRIIAFVGSPDFDPACRQARKFASEHSFESEFERRVTDIRVHLAA